MLTHKELDFKENTHVKIKHWSIVLSKVLFFFYRCLPLLCHGHDTAGRAGKGHHQLRLFFKVMEKRCAIEKYINPKGITKIFQHFQFTSSSRSVVYSSTFPNNFSSDVVTQSHFIMHHLKVEERNIFVSVAISMYNFH